MARPLHKQKVCCYVYKKTFFSLEVIEIPTRAFAVDNLPEVYHPENRHVIRVAGINWHFH